MITCCRSSQPESDFVACEPAAEVPGAEAGWRKYLIAGHADARASQQYNQRLSERCANALKRVLVEQFQVPSDTFIVVGYGKTRPKDIADPFNEENRRVNIVTTERK